MEQWLGRLSLYLVAEHGAWLREPGGDWRNLEPLNQEWEREIRAILELYMDRTPGFLIEEKNFSLVWHYPFFPRSQECIDRIGRNAL